MIKRSLAHEVLVVLVLACAGAASAGDGVVALQTADSSCPSSDGSHYFPCGNGTVTDNRSGLVWLANANCFGKMDLHAAMVAVAGLSDLPEDACYVGIDPRECDCALSDGSSAGEWRLPTLGEWLAMVHEASEEDCRPTIMNDIGTHCWVEGCYDVGLCSFYDVQPSKYWSSSPGIWGIDPATWFMDLDDGVKGRDPADETLHVWPVRGGQ